MELGIPETMVMVRLLELLEMQLLIKDVEVFHHFANRHKYTGVNQVNVRSSWNPFLFAHDSIFADIIHLRN